MDRVVIHPVPFQSFFRQNFRFFMRSASGCEWRSAKITKNTAGPIVIIIGRKLNKRNFAIFDSRNSKYLSLINYTGAYKQRVLGISFEKALFFENNSENVAKRDTSNSKILKMRFSLLI